MALPLLRPNQDYLLHRSDVAFTVPAGKKFAGVGYLRTQALQGIKVHNYEGYTVVAKQMLLGINPKSVTGRTPVKVRNSSTGKVKETTRPTAPLDIAKQYVEDLQTYTNQKYALVSDKAASGSNGGAHWFWIAPVNVIARLHKASPGGHFTTLSWGPA